MAKTCLSLFIYYTQLSNDVPIFRGLYVPVYLLPSLWLALHFPSASPWVRHIWLPLSPDLHVASSSSCAPLPCIEAQLEAVGRRSSPGFYSAWGARIWGEIPQICPSIQPAWVSLQKSPTVSYWKRLSIARLKMEKGILTTLYLPACIVMFWVVPWVRSLQSSTGCFWRGSRRMEVGTMVVEEEVTDFQEQ